VAFLDKLYDYLAAREATNAEKQRPDWRTEQKAQVAAGKSLCPCCYSWYAESDPYPTLGWYTLPEKDAVLAACPTCMRLGHFGCAEKSGALLHCGSALMPIVEPQVPYTLSVAQICTGHAGRVNLTKPTYRD
jgi:hypothetical protein